MLLRPSSSMQPDLALETVSPGADLYPERASEGIELQADPAPVVPGRLLREAKVVSRAPFVWELAMAVSGARLVEGTKVGSSARLAAEW